MQYVALMEMKATSGMMLLIDSSMCDVFKGANMAIISTHRCLSLHIYRMGKEVKEFGLLLPARATKTPKKKDTYQCKYHP